MSTDETGFRGLMVSLITDVAIGLVTLAAFAVARTRFPHLYSPNVSGYGGEECDEAGHDHAAAATSGDAHGRPMPADAAGDVEAARGRDSAAEALATAASGPAGGDVVGDVADASSSVRAGAAIAASPSPASAPGVAPPPPPPVSSPRHPSRIPLTTAVGAAGRVNYASLETGSASARVAPPGVERYGLEPPSKAGVAVGGFVPAPPPPVRGVSLCTLLRRVWRTTDAELIRVAGVDAYVYLAFLRTCLRIVCTIALYIGCVILPINLVGGRDESDLQAISLSNVESGSGLLWAHVLGVWLITGVTLHHLNVMYHAVAGWRHAYLSRPEVQNFAVLALNLPEAVAAGGDAAASAFFSGLFPHSFHSARVVHVTAELDLAVKKRQSWVFELEHAEAAFARTGLRPHNKTGCCSLWGQRVDTIDFCRQEIAALNVRVRELRQKIEKKDAKRLRRAAAAAAAATDAAGGAAGFDAAAMAIAAGDDTPRVGSFRDDFRALVDDGVGTARAAIGVAGSFFTEFFCGWCGCVACTAPQGLISDGSLTRSAVVCFTSIADRNLAVGAPVTRDGHLKLIPAPEPRSLKWRNLAVIGTQRRARLWVVNGVMFVLVFLWIVPVSFVASLTTLGQLSKVWPWLADVIYGTPVLDAYLEGFLPTIALSSFMAVLPLLLAMLTRSEGALSRSDVQIGVARKLFLFQLLNVFLGTTIAGMIFDRLDDIAADWTLQNVAELLGTSLPGVAVFFINYVLLMAFARLPVELLRLWPLINGTVCVACWKEACSCCCGVSTAGERARTFDPRHPWFGKQLSEALLVLMIALVYAVLQPLIIPVAAAYFAIALLVWKHQFLYVYRMTFHSGGRMWPTVFTRAVVGLVMAQATAIGVLPTYGASAQAAAVVPCVVVTVMWWRHTSSELKRTVKGLPLAAARAADASTARASKFPAPVPDRDAVIAAMASAYVEPSMLAAEHDA